MRVLAVTACAVVATAIGASLAPACTGPTFGIPSAPPGAPRGAPAPEPPPASGPVAPTNGGGAQGVVAPTGDRIAVDGGGAAPRSDSPSRENSAPRVPSSTPRRDFAQAPNSTAGAQFRARADNGTAGLTSRSGQTVYAPATPIATSSRTGAKTARPARSPRSAPSARTATGDLWNGFKPQTRASVFAAEASAPGQPGGLPAPGALIVLGLGLAGLVASTVFLGLRRRTVKAAAAAGDE